MAKTIADFKKDYADAEARGDAAGMQAANDGANAIRVSQGEAPQYANVAIANMAAKNAGSSLSTAMSIAELIRAQQSSNLEAELANLQAEYQAGMLGYSNKKKQIPALYDKARYRAEVQTAQEKRAFDERAEAQGLNSGTSGQAELARSAMLMRMLSDLDKEEAAALSGIDLEMAKLANQYARDVATAKAKSSSTLASALQEERLRSEKQEREDAKLAAELGDNSLLYALLGIDGNAGGSMPTTQQSDTQFVPTDVPGTGYDNGDLTQQDVKQLQAFFNEYKNYNLEVDGFWGQNSQNTTGMSANEAWEEYQNYLDQTQNYGGVAALAEQTFATGGKEAVLEMLRKAYSSGAITFTDYKALYNKYRG